ncbi:helix-turn-helix domain-containing protein [Methylobacterium sp. 1030]|uniref:helix-turn-helix domain-containing protein n=1 Tax=Methylobacterium sp. 1030 TaxID=3156404 RepID=UPI0033937F8D
MTHQICRPWLRAIVEFAYQYRSVATYLNFMQTVFSTQGLHPRDSFKRWQAMLSERSLPFEQQRLDDGLFSGKLEIASLDGLVMSRVSQDATRGEATPSLLRRSGDQHGRISVTFQLAGEATTQQLDRASIQRAGDFTVHDHKPIVFSSSMGSQAIRLELPRVRLENVLGSARHYAALTVGAELASAQLTTRFIQELIRVGNQLSPDATTRMAVVAVDLIVASIAERMAKELPRPLHGTVVVQRAKAFVEANFGDPTLDPPQLAAAVGVSLRRLQELFHERGQHISDWIWQRRLEAAAKRLADPGCVHLPIGTLAYGCGFASQSHFSRRFKDRFGMSPRECRHAAFGRAP